MKINSKNLNWESKRTGYSMATLQAMSQYIYGKHHANLTGEQKNHIVALLEENAKH